MLIFSLNSFGFHSDCLCIDTPIQKKMLINLKLFYVRLMIFLAFMLPSPYCIHYSEDQH